MAKKRHSSPIIFLDFTTHILQETEMDNNVANFTTYSTF